MASRAFADAAAAFHKLTSSASASPADWLNLAAAERAQGRLTEALGAVEGALKLDQRHFHALLMKANLLERLGRKREAGPAYGIAILQAPPDNLLDPATRQALTHARDVNRRYGDELSAFLRDNAGLDTGAEGESRRATQFVDHLLGRRRQYHQEPLGYFYPGLPAIEFWDRIEFPWIEALEAAKPAIIDELHGVLARDRQRFAPYVNYDELTPLDQWAELNRSLSWSAYHLIELGKAVEPNAGACPNTMAALAETDQPKVPNRSPSAMFSALAPNTHIPPHTGVSNTRLVCHLPLIVPEGCRFRVGNETRSYHDGRAFVFDDTIEHEAFNDSDQLRIILIFDLWNPRLSASEREKISEISALFDEFNSGPAGAAGL